MSAFLLLSALVAGLAVALPTAFPESTSACTFNDAATAMDQKASCTYIVLSGIVVPAGTTLDMTGLNDGTVVTFEGTTTFEFKEWAGPLVAVSGIDVTIQGAPGHVIDFGGDQYWDGKGSNGGATKPKAFYAHTLISSTIQDLNVKNTPVQFMSINGAKNLYIKNVVMDNSDGDRPDGGHNTDAFDIGSSTGVHISGAVVANQDDCLAVNSGTDISFTDGTCTGGHGLSIGSVGGRSDNVVKDILISNSRISDSENGVRIKTIYDATGSVSNVTYSDITLSNISKYGIVIQQDYRNGKPTGKPTTGVPITDLTLSNVAGSVADDATGIYVLCGEGSCSGWTSEGVSVSGGRTSTGCDNVPEGVSC